MKAVVIYWSKTGNTEKAARAIQAGLQADGADVELRTAAEAADVDYFAYDLVCIGFPSYQWSPPEAVVRLLQKKHRQYARQGWVRLNAPPSADTRALIFCTYSGPHTGIREAIPAGKVAGQFFEHLGIPVWDEWYIVGEYHGNLEASTRGCLGDIRGRPNEEDLRQIRERAAGLARRLTGAAA